MLKAWEENLRKKHGAENPRRALFCEKETLT